MGEVRGGPGCADGMAQRGCPLILRERWGDDGGTW